MSCLIADYVDHKVWQERFCSTKEEGFLVWHSKMETESLELPVDETFRFNTNNQTTENEEL
jgi:hypothetical protein